MDYDKLIKLRSVVSTHIEELLNDNDFELSIDFLKYIHAYLFKDVYSENGHYRTYNITKSESILRGDSVIYPDYHTIEEYLKYDIYSEKKIDYTKLQVEDKIKKIADFTSRIWLTHPFCEGNTRTVCVFIEKYLRTLNYQVSNDLFRINSGYFRDSLVRSNYYNSNLLIHNDLRPLILFFKKILIDNNIDLDDDLLYIKELYEPIDNIKVKKRLF